MRCCRVLDSDHLANYLTTRTGRTRALSEQTRNLYPGHSLVSKFRDHESIKTALLSLGVGEKLADLLAAEQIKRGSAHVERLSFIHLVRSFLCKVDDEKVIPANRFRWMSAEKLEKDLTAQALKRILNAGVANADLKVIMREAQIMVVEEIFTLLDNVSHYDGFPVDGFCLHALSGNFDEPDVLIDGLHEMVSELHDDQEN